MQKNSPFDVEQLKKNFTIFSEMPDLCYLDSAATSLTPDVVVDEMTDYYKKYRASVNRGSHALGTKATLKYQIARQNIANFFGANIDEVVFTKSTTSAINGIASMLEEFVNEGDEIIVSMLEHHANFLPWLSLATKKNAKLIILEPENLEITVENFKQHISSKTKIVALHHVSNAIGDIVDVSEICKLANQHKIISIIDGAQATPHMKVNMKQIGCNFYVASAHKMCGPTGIGFMYIQEDFADKLNPFELGGDMVTPSSVTPSSYQVKTGHLKFEAGTPAIAEVIGFGRAVEFLDEIGLDKIKEHEVNLKKYAISKLKTMSEVEVYNAEIENGIILFNIKNVKVHDAMSPSILNDITFDSENIAIRDGQHCNNLTMTNVLEQTAVLRASFYLYNTYEDVDKLIKQIKKIYKVWNWGWNDNRRFTKTNNHGSL
ncbi:MAG: aminotransferase class V-fold PLP-dependent enzyme [Mycoplasmatales bacterium]